MYCSATSGLRGSMTISKFNLLCVLTGVGVGVGVLVNWGGSVSIEDADVVCAGRSSLSGSPDTSDTLAGSGDFGSDGDVGVRADLLEGLCIVGNSGAVSRDDALDLDVLALAAVDRGVLDGVLTGS